VCVCVCVCVLDPSAPDFYLGNLRHELLGYWILLLQKYDIFVVKCKM
jgi:hypothetical protein